jgi:hypothetical protein
VILIVFHDDATDVRRVLERAGITVLERRHWLLWRRLEMIGSPKGIADAQKALALWRGANWWREQW